MLSLLKVSTSVEGTTDVVPSATFTARLEPSAVPSKPHSVVLDICKHQSGNFRRFSSQGLSRIRLFFEQQLLLTTVAFEVKETKTNIGRQHSDRKRSAAQAFAGSLPRHKFHFEWMCKPGLGQNNAHSQTVARTPSPRGPQGLIASNLFQRFIIQLRWHTLEGEFETTRSYLEQHMPRFEHSSHCFDAYSVLLIQDIWSKTLWTQQAPSTTAQAQLQDTRHEIAEKLQQLEVRASKSAENSVLLIAYHELLSALPCSKVQEQISHLAIALQLLQLQCDTWASCFAEYVSMRVMLAHGNLIGALEHSRKAVSLNHEASRVHSSVYFHRERDFF
jgi:hypothetical protein